MGRFQSELRRATLPSSTADLTRQGVSQHELAERRWLQTSRGFHRPAEVAEVTPTQRILDVAATLPGGGIIGGWAAAYALGADLLDGFDDFSMRALPVPTILPAGLHREPNRDTVVVQRWSEAARPQPLDLVVIEGIPVTGPVRTALDLARSAPNLTEAVVVLDTLLAARITDADTLLAAMSGFRGTRGIRQTRRALTLSDAGVRSPWESRLRMFWVLDLVFPVPLVNKPVFNPYGTFLGAPDLLDAEAGLAMEYDGTQWASARQTGHRDERQHHEDNVREEGFERAGLIVARCDKTDLIRDRRRLTQRLRSARSDGLARDRTRDRWTIEAPPGWLGLPA